MKIFGNIVEGLQKNMDLTMLRQEIINANIANADTPGYKPKDLEFTQELAQFLKMSGDNVSASDAAHFGSQPKYDEVTGEVIEQAGAEGADGNGVDLDRQMAMMTSNSFNYRASAKFVHKKMALLKYVINETR